MKSKKKSIGLVVLLAGVVLFFYARHEQNRVGNAKEMFSRGTSMFSGNAINDSVGGAVEANLSQYDTPLKLCAIGGIILIVVGASTFLCSCKKK
jgi:hypothetical protein